MTSAANKCVLVCVLVHGCRTEVLEALRGVTQSFHAQVCTNITRRRWVDSLGGCHELGVTSSRLGLGTMLVTNITLLSLFQPHFCHRSQSLALTIVTTHQPNLHVRPPILTAHMVEEFIQIKSSCAL
jgi:hypothetical protein